MLAYIISFAVGLGVGGLYALINVASPAPPIIALLGLLGMVTGETVVKHFKSPSQNISQSVAELCTDKQFTVSFNSNEKTPLT